MVCPSHIFSRLNLLFSVVESHISLFSRFRNRHFRNRHFGCKDNNITRLTQMFSAKISENPKIFSESTSDYTSFLPHSDSTSQVFPSPYPRRWQAQTACLGLRHDESQEKSNIFLLFSKKVSMFSKKSQLPLEKMYYLCTNIREPK